MSGGDESDDDGLTDYSTDSEDLHSFREYIVVIRLKIQSLTICIPRRRRATEPMAPADRLHLLDSEILVLLLGETYAMEPLTVLPQQSTYAAEQ